MKCRKNFGPVVVVLSLCSMFILALLSAATPAYAQDRQQSYIERCWGEQKGTAACIRREKERTGRTPKTYTITRINDLPSKWELQSSTRAELRLLERAVRRFMRTREGKKNYGYLRRYIKKLQAVRRRL